MISIIIPCYNEEKNISFLLDEINKLKIKDKELIVVDNGSDDKTSEVVKMFDNVKLIIEKKRGKGFAVRKGAKESRGDVLVFIDGDNSYSAKFIPKLLKPILKGEKDIVYGSRFLKKSKTKISKLRLIGNKFFSLLGYFLCKKKLDFLTGLFAIKKDKFLELVLNSKGFEIETEIFKKSVKKDFRISQVPIEYQANKESQINPIFDGLKIFLTLLKN